ncbi:hypothetical protein DPX16_21343 [Anabarilius grahami]|uniref:Uncharacterized protein n=1 Tax=Anabarilius grahami TaxID=495550 RepID=A0A3N0XEM4_ANAGA|nr:hypothetical protein DPX16_21343 [Anabarilius grahami]
MAATPELPTVMAAISEPPAIMDIMPDSPAIESIIPESSAIMDVTSRFPVIMHIANEVVKAVPRCKRLVSSLDDASLMRVHSSGTPAVVLSQELKSLLTSLLQCLIQSTSLLQVSPDQVLSAPLEVLLGFSTVLLHRGGLQPCLIGYGGLLLQHGELQWHLICYGGLPLCPGGHLPNPA